MPNRRLLHSALLLVALSMLLPPVAAATETAPLPPGSAVEKSLAGDFPQIMNDFERILPTPVEGLYEVQTRKGLLYYFPATGHVLAGQLMDKTGRNLTRESIGRQMADKLADLPLDQAIRIGNGPHTVIEFTDPDCPYCRKGAEFWAERGDVTRYVYFYPLPNHPQAGPKARFVLAAENPAKAYEEVMTGKYDQAELPAFEPTGRLDRHMAIAEEMGVRSTPSYWINGTFVNGANIEAFKKLLSQPPAADKSAEPPEKLKKYGR